MRPILFTLAALPLMAGLTFFASGHTAELAAQEADPWAGAYLKKTLDDTDRSQFGEAQHIKITKGVDGYYLSKPYDERKFTEVEKGVLSDGNGGLGKIYLGSATFADGQRLQILRVDFCYEQFILCGRLKEPAKKPKLKGK